MTTHRTTKTPRTTRTVLAALALAAAALLTACTAAEATTPSAHAVSPATTLRLGYFDNVTHAPALVGLKTGLLQKALGSTKLQTQKFSAGPSTIEALNAGAIDAAYLGPSPAISSYVQSEGRSLRIVAGATNGGAALVVAPNITSASGLKGATLASPQLGNTQDVALRYWLKSKGLTTQTTGGGDVTINPTENAQSAQLFKTGAIAGAWLPEPWVSALVEQAGAHVLVDEASLWPHGTFPTTVLVVSQAFLAAHPATVASLVAGNAASIAWLNAHPADAAATINAQLAADTGKSLAAPVIARALQHVTFSTDPAASTFPTLLAHAVAVGTGRSGSLDGLFALKVK